jgi:hypothetical protein
MKDNEGPGLLGGLFLLLSMGIIQLAFAAFFFLLLYGVVIIIFRYAFGVELPNPFSYVPPDWRQRAPWLP